VQTRGKKSFPFIAPEDPQVHRPVAETETQTPFHPVVATPDIVRKPTGKFES